MTTKLTAPDIYNSLRGAQRVLVLTGAGVSAESGVPTFRDKQGGLWKQFNAADLATPYAFHKDADLVWGWYEWRRMQVIRAQPNLAHRAIAALAELVPRLTVVTQNVDDLHERGGSQGVLHLHGSLAHPRCERCEQTYTHPPGVPDLPVGGTRIEPPRRSRCGARVRPGVVWFGESLPELPWMASVEAASNCEVFFSIGTSSLVAPASSLVEHARRAGALTVQVNPNSTGAESTFSFVLQGPAGLILPNLLKEIWNRPVVEDHA